MDTQTDIQSSGGARTLYFLGPEPRQTKQLVATSVWLENEAVPDVEGFGSMVNLSVAASNDFELGQTVLDAAASMTIPSLKDIREKATPVFGGALSYALDIWSSCWQEGDIRARCAADEDCSMTRRAWVSQVLSNFQIGMKQGLRSTHSIAGRRSSSRMPIDT